MKTDRAARRQFLKQTGAMLCALAYHPHVEAGTSPAIITNALIDSGVSIEASDGTVGSFSGSPQQDLKTLERHLPEIRQLLVGREVFDSLLSGEAVWNALYPDTARLFAEGRDPLTNEVILNKPRNARHTSTGKVFIAISTLDVALWDLRSRVLGKPGYRVIGTGNRTRVPVYWRPGEVGIAPSEARRLARAAFDRGYRSQKWYFSKGAGDGEQGFKENVELVRALREELPEANLMFDNHTIRYSDDVAYSLKLCKAVAPYNPFWIEEPICPEHREGYARIKGETGLTIAGGEHWYTRWSVKPFLDRKCVDYVQCDPTWCGGISEWLAICAMVRLYPGVRVVPHITSPWIVAPQCVASQPEDLCPLLEYNAEGGFKALDANMHPLPDGRMAMTMPDRPGIS